MALDSSVDLVASAFAVLPDPPCLRLGLVELVEPAELVVAVAVDVDVAEAAAVVVAAAAAAAADSVAASSGTSADSSTFPRTYRGCARKSASASVAP